MATDEHTKMQFMEFLEVLGLIAEVRTTSRLRMAGGPRKPAKATMEEEEEEEEEEVAVAAAPEAGAGSGGPPPPVDTASPGVGVGVTGAIPSSPGGPSSALRVVLGMPPRSPMGSPMGGLSSPFAMGAGMSAGEYVDHGAFLAELAVVLSVVCSTVDPDRNAKGLGVAGAAMGELIKQGSNRKFKGGGAAQE